MGLVFSISNFFINKISQGRKSVCGLAAAIYLKPFGLFFTTKLSYTQLFKWGHSNFLGVSNKHNKAEISIKMHNCTKVEMKREILANFVLVSLGPFQCFCLFQLVKIVWSSRHLRPTIFWVKICNFLRSEKFSNSFL